MKNYDCWKNFVKTGKIDDYLHYIACTNEDCMDDFLENANTTVQRGDISLQNVKKKFNMEY